MNVGSVLPEINIALSNEQVSLRSRFHKSHGILFSVLGAFHPYDTDQRVPAFRDLAQTLRSKGIDFIGCIAVNDAYVLKAWARKLKVSSQITFISDTNGLLMRTLGIQQNPTDLENVLRSSCIPRPKRFAALIRPSGIVKLLTFEEDPTAFLTQVSELLKVDENLKMKAMSLKPTRLICDMAFGPTMPGVKQGDVTLQFFYESRSEGLFIEKTPYGVKITSRERTFGSFETQGSDTDVEFHVTEVELTSAVGAKMQDEGVSSGLLTIWHDSDENTKAVVVFPLEIGGRDYLLANLMASKSYLDLSEERVAFNGSGIHLSHLIYPGLEFAKFSDLDSVQWFVATTSIFVSSEQIQALAGLVSDSEQARVPTVPSHEVYMVRCAT